MNPLEIGKYFIAQGVLGAVVVALVWWIIKLTKELNDEKTGRLEDSKTHSNDRLEDTKSYAENSLAMQNKVIDAVSKMNELVEMVIPPQAPPRRPGSFHDR